MIQTLLPTGSPVVAAILAARKTYYLHLLTSLMVTTMATIIWVVSVMPESRTDVEEQPFMLLNKEVAVDVLYTSPGNNDVIPQPPSNDSASMMYNIETEPILSPSGASHGPSEVDSVAYTTYLEIGYKDMTGHDILFDVCPRVGWLWTGPSGDLQARSISIPKRRRTLHELLTEVLAPYGMGYWKQPGSRMVSIYHDHTKKPS